jgi:RNA polymerase sigma factor (sigma-70 family)
MLHTTEGQTMLDIDTLNALDDLLATTLYAAEVARLPRLSFAEEQDLVIRARAGSPEARHALVVSCLRYGLGKARVSYNTEQPAHDDLLDLAQVASLAMLEDLDRALKRQNPCSYLRGIARRAIALYISYRLSLVSKPSSFTKKMFEKYDVVTVESLDAPLSSKDTVTHLEFVQAPAADLATLLEEEEHLEERHAHYTVLYEALEALSPRQRQVITLRFGLDGEAGMRRDIISELIGGTYEGINAAERAALKVLRRALEAHGAALACSDADEA